MRFDTTEMGDTWTEVCAYGTAVVAVPITDAARETAQRLGYGRPRLPSQPHLWARTPTAAGGRGSPSTHHRAGGMVGGMTSDDHSQNDGAPDDLADMKAKMREALDRKNAKAKGVAEDAPLKEKAHGSEVQGGAGPKMHRRKAGGGGS